MDTQRQIERGYVPPATRAREYPVPLKWPDYDVDEAVIDQVKQWAKDNLDPDLTDAAWFGGGWVVVVDNAAQEARQNIDAARRADDRAQAQWWTYVLVYLSFQIKEHAERLELDLSALEQAYYNHVDGRFGRPEYLLITNCDHPPLQVDTCRVRPPLDLSTLDD